MFAAINSIELKAQTYIHLRDAVSKDLKKAMIAKLHERLLALENNLGTNHYLKGAFTVGDIAMTTVLREVAAEGALSDFSSIQAYMNRNEARLFRP